MDRLDYRRGWLQRCGLRDHEEWPLFGVEKRVSPSTNQVWVLLTSLPSLDGHRDGLRRLLGEIRQIEYRCESEGIAGWLQVVKRGNAKIQYWAKMVGAEIYAEDEDFVYFKKEANVSGLPLTMKELVARYRGGSHYGQA